MMVPMSEQVACVSRELKLRRRAYPRLVEAGKLSQQAADAELRRMAAVLETLRIVEEKERLL